MDSSASGVVLRVWDQPEEREEDPQQRLLARAQQAAKRREKINQAVTTISLLLIGFYALGVMLIELAFILVPLVFSRFLVYIFAPLIGIITVSRGQPTGVPRWAAVLVCLLLLFLFFGLLVLIIGLTIKSVIADSQVYLDDLNKMAGDFLKLASSFGYTEEQLLNMLPDINVGDWAISILQTFFDLIPQIVLIFLLLVYMLLGVEVSPDTKKTKLENMIDSQIRSYIMIHSLTSVIVGVGATFILFVFGTDLCLFFGLTTFILNFIPNVGSVVATLLPVPIILLSPDFALWRLLGVALSLTTMHFVVGQVLEPMILGDRMEVPPITVIICLLFWGSVWGLVGAILSVPLTTSIKVYLENIDHPATHALAGMIVGDFSFFDTSEDMDDNDMDGDDGDDDHHKKLELEEERIPILHKH